VNFELIKIFSNSEYLIGLRNGKFFILLNRNSESQDYIKAILTCMKFCSILKEDELDSCSISMPNVLEKLKEANLWTQTNFTVKRYFYKDFFNRTGK